MDELAALIFGVVAGLRTFTGEAVFFGVRTGAQGIVFIALALLEYAGDLYPKAPPRTALFSALVRLISGAFMGWIAGGIIGAVLGIVGALIGTFGGLRFRLWLIGAIGPLNAGLLEDVLALGLAFLALRLVLS